MRDMRDLSRFIAVLAAQCDIHQAAFNKTKDKLDKALYDTFHALYHIRNGDRIVYAGKVGKAVILRDNTKLGLYIQYENGPRGRYPIHDPASVTLKPRKQR